jgi:ABC-type Fe3+-siderophore transport system permease subunit
MYFMGLLLIVLALIDLRLGSIRISLGDITGHLWGGEELSDQQLVILTRFRLPRLATALLAGAALHGSELVRSCCCSCLSPTGSKM